ncbi:MAG: hypothetical protein MJA27_20155 [Pseudanabaenales cyanobacterium]|nr:hypothetical protein [Pseudanabaenales cyanobacterium]
MKVDIFGTKHFSFSRPQFGFGQCVKTQDGAMGYITGLTFYPDLQDWVYYLYRIDQDYIEEMGYQADELEAFE